MQYEDTITGTLHGTGRTAPWWKTAMPLLCLALTGCGTKSAYLPEKAEDDKCLTIKCDPSTGRYTLNILGCIKAAQGENFGIFTRSSVGEENAWQRVRELNSEQRTCRDQSASPAP